jgi:YVTN family beta-propeller protein
VTVVDPHARSEVARILVGRNPSGIAVDPDGERIYVANSGSNDVSIVDVRAAAETSRVKVGKQPWASACSGDRLYVANAHADTMSVVDTDAQRVLDTVRTGRRPTSLFGLGQDSALGFVGTADPRRHRSHGRVPVQPPAQPDGPAPPGTGPAARQSLL